MQIFSSKGDIGDFRNNKKERTVPMVPRFKYIFLNNIFEICVVINLWQHEVLVLSQESNLHTEQKVQHDPPVELFNMVIVEKFLNCQT